MQVDGARTKVVAAWQCNVGMAVTAEQWAEHIDRCSDSVDLFEWGNRGHVAVVDQYQFVRAHSVGLDAERPKQIAHDIDVCNVGDVGQAVLAFCQQRDRHQFEDRVLGTRHLDFATECLGAFYDNLHDAISMLAQ